jgi:hypothetical protein
MLAGGAQLDTVVTSCTPANNLPTRSQCDAHIDGLYRLIVVYRRLSGSSHSCSMCIVKACIISIRGWATEQPAFCPESIKSADANPGEMAPRCSVHLEPGFASVPAQHLSTAPGSQSTGIGPTQRSAAPESFGSGESCVAWQRPTAPW